MANFVRYNLNMQHTKLANGDQLATALHALGINFILSGNDAKESLHSHPSRLIAGLAKSDEARLRLSLIPLFLTHPEYARYVRSVARKLEPSAQLTLQCYYSAAVWLAIEHRQNCELLPDYFSKELMLAPGDNPEENLLALAKRHKELSGSYANWLATYRHAEDVWQKGLSYKV